MCADAEAPEHDWSQWTSPGCDNLSEQAKEMPFTLVSGVSQDGQRLLARTPHTPARLVELPLVYCGSREQMDALIGRYDELRAGFLDETWTQTFETATAHARTKTTTRVQLELSVARVMTRKQRSNITELFQFTDVGKYLALHVVRHLMAGSYLPGSVMHAINAVHALLPVGSEGSDELKRTQRAAERLQRHYIGLSAPDAALPPPEPPAPGESAAETRARLTKLSDYEATLVAHEMFGGDVTRYNEFCARHQEHAMQDKRRLADLARLIFAYDGALLQRMRRECNACEQREAVYRLCACHSVGYCSEACQRTAWAAHRERHDFVLRARELVQQQQQ